MSQHTIQKFGLALLLAGTLVTLPAPASAAGRPTPPDLGDSIRPRIMQLAATRQGAALPAPHQLNTKSATLSPGTSSRTSTPAVQRQVFGYVNDGNLGNPDVGYTTWDYSLMTTVAYFGLDINGDGSINTGTSNTGWNVWNSSTLTDFVAMAHSHGVKVVVSLIQHDSPSGSLCSSLSASAIANTVYTVVFQVNQKGVDGVNIDYEGPGSGCTTSTQAAGIVSLAQQFRSSLNANAPGRNNLTIATYGSSYLSGGFFDVPALNQYVDSFFVMAYDLDLSNTWPGTMSPVAPLGYYMWNDTRIAQGYLGVVPGSKVILGVPYYGRTACVASYSSSRPGPNAAPNTSTETTPTYLDSISTNNDTADGVVYGSWQESRDVHDTAGQEPYSTWQSAPSSWNCWRESYWDDPTSLGNKYNLVNSDDLAGTGLFALDYGGGDSGLWSALALHFTNLPAAPTGVAACAAQTSASVSWRPAYSPHGAVTGYVVTAWSGSSVVATQTVGAGATMTTVTGLTAGTSYTFTVQATDSHGAGPGAYTNSVTPYSTGPTAASYFAWYDLNSPGMAGDNVHLLARPGGTTASAGCVTVTGVAVLPFSISPGQEQVLSFPAGTIGGPLAVTLFQGNQLIASQRVEYYQSFNEVPAAASSAAATSLQFAWYDHKSSPGFVGDNIHVINPAGSLSPSQVTVAIPGCTPAVTPFGSSELIYSCPFGSGFGGPVTVSATVPVLASQRVQYYQSFNEEWGQQASAASPTLQFSWYDRISSPGFQGDNIHVWNPAGTAFTATAQIPGCTSQMQSVAAGGEAIFTCAKGFGGPVTVTGSVPILAAQRVQYYQSFNEVPGAGAAQAGMTLYSAWFDRISSPGFKGDNIHVWNPAGAAFSATVAIPGCSSQSQSVAAGQEAIFTCSGGFGGPVVITSSTPLLASQRVQFYQSFNEVLAEG